MEEDEDDFYAPEEEEEVKPKVDPEGSASRDDAMEDESAEEEEDDDDDDNDSDSDIEIITDHPTDSKPEPPTQNQQRGPSAKAGATVKAELPTTSIKPTIAPAVPNEASKKPSEPLKPGSSYPAIHTSTIDLEAKPIHEASGKPITEVDMDGDFGEDDKPWRRPGSDQTDYFNYGFDEFTWASYCLKQESLRKEAKDQKKQLEDMQSFMNMGGGSAPSAPGAMGGMVGGPTDLPPEMQQMMQQMMATGMDPTQMDFNQFMQMMQPGAQQGMGGGNFGQGNQHMGGGFGGFGGGGGGAAGGGGGGGHGGHGGRGRGRGRW